MNKKITAITINPNWLYHRITPKTLDQILESKEIKSKKELLTLKEIVKSLNYSGWNGFNYISLAKKEPEILEPSSYNLYIKPNYALIISKVPAIKTIYTQNILFKNLSIFPTNLRFSNFHDEYQVKKSIPLSKVIGIKIPSQNPSMDRSNETLAYDLNNQTQILAILQKHNLSIPFIDIETSAAISPEHIQEYQKTKVR